MTRLGMCLAAGLAARVSGVLTGGFGGHSRICTTRLLLLLGALVAGAGAGGAAAWADVRFDGSLLSGDLERRARALDALLRCVVCESESVASSRSDWAADVRALVRDLVRAGHSDTEVLAFFQARYGDYVLMRPPFSGANVVLWLAAPLLAAAGLAAGLAYVRRRARAQRAAGGGSDDLNAAERARLAALLAEGRGDKPQDAATPTRGGA